MSRTVFYGVLVLLLQGCQAQGDLVAASQEISLMETLEYYLYYPADYEVDPKKEYGLLLFLHGGGEAGGELGALKENGPPKLLAEGKQFPFLVLAPQNPYEKKWWDIRAVNQLLDAVIEENKVDKNRIYLTGLSRGGSAAWEMAVQYPNKFAALAVVCGMTPTPYAHWLDKAMPIWVFHGDNDQVIPVAESDAMVAKLKDMGYTVRYSRYQGVGHNSWARAYTTEELYEWFNQQKRK